MKITFRKLLHGFRREYATKGLKEEEVLDDPITMFEKWMRQADKFGVWDPNAFVLATTDSKGMPATRIVLLKSVDSKGFIFFTNYNSAKGKHIKARGKASMLFFWPELIRQVRIDGIVKKIPKKDSAEYFHSRPRGSQISAVASPQSTLVSGRKWLEDKYKEIATKYKGEEVPCPSNWGGYIIVPKKIEFWHGRLNRLHDRLVFTPGKNKEWKRHRLAP